MTKQIITDVRLQLKRRSFKLSPRMEAKYDGHILIHNKQGIHKHVATFELSLSGLEWNVKKY